MPAQVDNKALAEPYKVAKGEAKSLHFRLTNLNFMRNNEYFTPIVQGQTFFGYQLAPSLIYLPTEDISVEAGVFVRHDFGRQDYAQIMPIFSFRYEYEHNAYTTTSLIFGTLQGNLQHNLIEPLYAFERTLTNHLENGFQFKHQNHRLKLDAWVDWQQVAYPRGNQQEYIWAGINTSIFLLKRLQKHISFRLNDGSRADKTISFQQLLINLQATTFHQGGQNLSLPTPLPATNSFQLAGGLRYERKKWFAEAYYLRTIREVYQDSVLSVRVGNGFYAQVGKKFVLGKLEGFESVLSYWQGHSVDNVLGGDLYKSFPTYPDGMVQLDRRLLILRLSKTWKLADNIHLIARLEPYYDFVNARLEQVQMLMISFRPTFKLSKN